MAMNRTEAELEEKETARDLDRDMLDIRRQRGRILEAISFLGEAPDFEEGRKAKQILLGILADIPKE